MGETADDRAAAAADGRGQEAFDHADLVGRTLLQRPLQVLLQDWIPETEERDLGALGRESQ